MSEPTLEDVQRTECVEYDVDKQAEMNFGDTEFDQNTVNNFQGRAIEASTFVLDSVNIRPSQNGYIITFNNASLYPNREYVFLTLEDAIEFIRETFEKEKRNNG